MVFGAAASGCGAAPPSSGSSARVASAAPISNAAPSASPSSAPGEASKDVSEGGTGEGGDAKEDDIDRLDGAVGRGGLSTGKAGSGSSDTTKSSPDDKKVERAGDSPSPPPPAQAATMSSTPLSGRLSQQAINDVLSKNAALFDECYSIGAGASRDFHATVSVRATLGPSGAVSDAQVIQSDAKNAKVDSCVANAIRKIKFPVPKDAGASVVTFPIEFQGAEKRR